MLYVDDILIASTSKHEIKVLKAALCQVFEMKDLGAAKKILGMELKRDRSRGTLLISREAYFDKIIRKFHMESAKPVNTPFAQHFRLSMAQSPQEQFELDDMQNVLYANLVGSLMYGMVCSRPDLAHSMSVVSRFMGNPGKSHWEACKWIVRYLKGTSSKGLLYTKSQTNSDIIVGFVDSDYAADID